MSKGRIKAVLFIIVFLLVIAVAVNLLMDMQSEKKAEATPTNRSEERRVGKECRL